ncbi:uncharacterized protein LOC130731674 [Lotus japonicus]|uniref:uncharacterized protein LOC130731674 n=1 Tax=Lotus japonicus TaxID=34305 RepID=UPI00258A5478|nr:uncharacterized protein LOC130731674 [Lotus japonicus]
MLFKIQATFESTWEDRTQKASEQNAPPPNELDVWLEVAGVKKGRIYGLGMESTVMHNKYRGSSSSSSEWVRREEFDQLRDTLDITQKMVRQMMEMMQTTAPTNVHTDHGDNSDDLEESEDADDLGGS